MLYVELAPCTALLRFRSYSLHIHGRWSHRPSWHTFPTFRTSARPTGTLLAFILAKTTKRSRCRDIVNQKDCQRAEKLRSDIPSSSSDKQRKQDLKEYAALCCCRSKHRTNFQKLDDIHGIADKWYPELVCQSLIALIVVPTSPPQPRFRAYEADAPKDALESILISALRKQEFANETLYMVK